jgi:hypothetical protein
VNAIALPTETALLNPAVMRGVRAVPGSSTSPSQTAEELGAFYSALIESFGGKTFITSNEANAGTPAGSGAPSVRKTEDLDHDGPEPAEGAGGTQVAPAATGLDSFPSLVFLPPVDHPLCFALPFRQEVRDDSATQEGSARLDSTSLEESDDVHESIEPLAALGTQTPISIAAQSVLNPPPASPSASSAVQDAPVAVASNSNSTVPVADLASNARSGVPGDRDGQVRKRDERSTERAPIPEVMRGEMRPRVAQSEEQSSAAWKLPDPLASKGCSAVSVRLAAPSTAQPGGGRVSSSSPLSERQIRDGSASREETNTAGHQPAVLDGPAESPDQAGTDCNRNLDRPEEERPAQADPRKKLAETAEPAPSSELSHSHSSSHHTTSGGLPGGMPAVQRPSVEPEPCVPETKNTGASAGAAAAPPVDADAPVLQSVQIQLEDESGSGVNLRFVESGGGVRVSVRTQDSSLADALTANSQALEGRLQAAGWNSEFRPVAEASSGWTDHSSPDVRPRQEGVVRGEAATAVVRGTQMEFGAGSGDSSGERPSTWADRNEDLLNAIALRRLANKGVTA